tara:strand:+ start:65 stop:832 length:768 start_codon:yes stop_codon:yes gene_type:complete
MIEIPIRQSWLGTFTNCPEQSRQERLNLVQTRESSDLMRGNMVHNTIEYCGKEFMHTGRRVSFEEASNYMDSITPDLAKLVVEWRHKYESVVDVARNNLFAWHEQVFPELMVPTGVEQSFRIPLDERDGVRLVLTGTADWVQPDLIIDWKNPSREYVPWEQQRWNLQASVYCFAFGIPHFDNVALVNGKVQVIHIERRDADVEALRDLCWSAAALIQSDLKVWPMRWAGWHCSPKWCPVWQAGECRGKHLGPTPW